jgi:predicted homoserine dehydrogenase-like protein
MDHRRLRAELVSRSRSARPLRLAIAGAGFLGRSLIHQCARTPGLCVAAVGDRRPDKALAALGSAPVPRAGAVCGGVEELRTALWRGGAGVCADPLDLVELEVDAVVDCTGDPELGAALGLAALERGRAFFANAETDATVGPALARRARAAGVLYSGCGGDEHTEALQLVRYAELLELEVVAAGKFKGFLDRASTPASVAPWAERHVQNPFMLCSFADGTKMRIEMAILANATGILPDVRGMHCPRVERDAVAGVLSEEHGGLLHAAGAVEVVVGAQPSTAVFAVVRTRDPELARELAYLHMGAGPTYLLVRPFHLCGIELAASIAGTLLADEPAIAPRGAPVAAVFAAAKRDLQPGTALERMGGTTHYGVIDAAAAVSAEGLLPVGLARGARLTRFVRRGAPIGLDDVEVEGTSAAWQLHAEAVAVA